ncbi:viperin family antiviral radical SAM protein [Psychrobacter glacincola]|uniref:viperin family antiviral radical SAM protein n=1 Tax=Psychrobacter glacincola TaxID=56810 RepID=UPI0039B0A71F
MDNGIKIQRELVVNWHITEACNYHCNYCFAKWDKQKNELMNDENSVSKLMDEIQKLPAILNGKYLTEFESIRLNLVGGETFLNIRKVTRIIHQAKQRKFSLSAITNGSRLNNELVTLIANDFNSIGFSVDSLDSPTNIKIGRTEKSGVMDTEKVLRDISVIKELNPSIDIKINTVVSSLNQSEDLSAFIDQAAPNKWKVFKVLPVITRENEVSQDDFIEFLERHSKFENIISSEDNDEMTDSYLMIDPIGRFFQNSILGSGYSYSTPIVNTGIEEALNEINFDPEKFHGRYKTSRITMQEVF